MSGILCFTTRFNFRCKVANFNHIELLNLKAIKFEFKKNRIKFINSHNKQFLD